MITTVTTPDGRKVKVEHPKGATQSEIISYAKANYKNQPEKKTLSAKEKRDLIGGGTLKFGPFDTGVETPQWLDESLAGMGRRMTGIGTLGTNKPQPEADALLDDSVPAMLGGAATDVGALLLGGTALKTAGAIPKIGKGLYATGQALSAPKGLKSGVAAATAYGAATSRDRLGAGAGSAIGQSVGYGVPKMAGKIVAPHLKSAARSIIKGGGTVTPGEAFGGVLQRFEDAGTSVPVLGDAIKSAKRRTIGGFGKAQINDALEVVGSKLDDAIPAGRESIAKADDILSAKYDEALSGMDVKVDKQFAGEINKLAEMAKQMPEKESRKFQQIISEKLIKPFSNPNQMLLGRTFKKTDSGLRADYKRFMKNQDPYVQDLGDAVRSAHKSLLDLGKRQNPVSGEVLDKLDIAYAKMSRISEAASYKGATEGLFTPDHLLSSIKKTATKKQYGSGRAFGQKEMEAAKDMLAQTIPDSGTVPRALFNTAALGGAYTVNPAAAATVLSGAGLYTKPGQKVMQAAMSARPAGSVPLRKGLEYVAPYSGLLGVAGGIQLAQ